MPLNHLKQLLLLETAEFSVSRGTHDDHDFKWWVFCTLLRRDLIIAGVNKSVIRVTYKHGVEILTSISQDKRLDEKN